MYIPVVVAMSASQNVKAAISGGWMALIVAVVATGFCYACIPLLSKMVHKKQIKTNERYHKTVRKNGLVFSFLVVGIIMYASYYVSKK